MLSPYRVVDLTDEGAMICGQILGDLGADVILVEPSAGAAGTSDWTFHRRSAGSQPEPQFLVA